MSGATGDEFQRVKRLALAGIEAYQHRAKLRRKPTFEEQVQVMQGKAARGEAVTEAELGALAAALAAQHAPKRGRGRPKGTQDSAAKAAFFSACAATESCNLRPYRNNATGHRLTWCDALAEAMNEAGYTSLSTYDAATAELKVIRRSLKSLSANLREMGQRIEAAANGIAAVVPRMRTAMQFKLSPKTLEAIKNNEKTRR